MPLKIIGTGFGRTGTDSMRKALNMLEFGPTHHMFEFDGNPYQEKLWKDLVLGAPPNWEKLFNGYNSCIDWPSAFYWRELIIAYPDAQVLLTWRSAESWWTSFENTILKYILGPDDSDSFFSQKLVAEKVFSGRPDDRAHAISVYNNNVEEVIATVPEHRLLIFKTGDGWGPLCRHLGVDIPESDFPHSNTQVAFFD
jgi:hypothetical protein